MKTQVISIVNLITILLSTKLINCQFESSFPGGNFMRIWMINSNTVRFNVIVPNNQYFAIGFGKTMTNCDMVVWQARQGSSYVNDLYSTGRSTPRTDSQQNYNSTFTYNQTHVVFNSDRYLSTGDSSDFTIPQNTSITCNYAYVSSTSNLVEHTNQAWGNFVLKLTFIPPTNTSGNGSNSTNTTVDFPAGNVTGGIIDIRDELMGYDILYLHGWLLWVAWGALGLVQIASARYLKTFPKINHWLHIVNGCVIGILTLIMSLLAFKYYDWQIRDNLHSQIGFACLIIVGYIILTGFTVKIVMNNLKWKTNRIQYVKFIHKYSSYGLLVVSQIAILVGVEAYNKRNGKEGDYGLGIASFVVFFSLWGLAELIYQIQINRLVTYDTCEEVITSQQFRNKIKKGAKLVILDDMVLDVSSYQYNHPGGAFTIQHNIGRDISKFFYGGYQIENYTGSKHPHNHTSLAKQQVNNLMIAKLDFEAPEFLAKIVIKDEVVRKHTFTMTFQSQYEIPGVKRYYSDINMIGKHYLINHLQDQSLKRQYTICNCIQVDQYKEYLTMINHFRNNKKSSPGVTPMKGNDIFFDENDSNQLFLTIKNYNIAKGLSKKFYDESIENVYQIKGPMGKGLDIKPEGTHIAFTAGTGVLVFLDLAAHLLRKNLRKLSSFEDQQISRDKFKFVLFVSFPNKQDIIGYQLCKGVKQISKSLKLDNFEYFYRITSEQDQQGPAALKRWDIDFIQLTIEKYQNDLQKIWVCGPPKMNEDFDKMLANLSKKYDFDKDLYEIL